MYRHFHCTNSSCFYDSFCHAKYDQYAWLVSFQRKTVGIDKFLNSFADHSTLLLASRCATAYASMWKERLDYLETNQNTNNNNYLLQPSQGY